MNRSLQTLVAGTLLVTPALAWAEAGGNDACPAQPADADDVRETYDGAGRLLHQMRLQAGTVVQEVSIVYDRSGHPTERLEVSAQGRRLARTRWEGDKLAGGECLVAGRVIAATTYSYDGDHLVARRDVHEGEPVRITTTRYDAFGNPVGGDTRSEGGPLTYRWEAQRALPVTPIKIVLTGGGTYQSDTQLFDATAGIGLHRKPDVAHYSADPLEVALDGTMRFHRAAGVTSTDQTHARLGVDYNDLLPRTTLFSFTAVDRNVPANLKLNLEEGFLGIKYDVVAHPRLTADVSFAPVWTLRAIIEPPPANSTSAATDAITSTLRGSLRLRVAYGSPTARVTDVLEFLPALYGDEVNTGSSVADRSILRNSVTLELAVAPNFKFRQELRYTRDPSLRAQASCPDSANPLCSGYTVATVTALSVELDIGR